MAVRAGRGTGGSPIRIYSVLNKRMSGRTMLVDIPIEQVERELSDLVDLYGLGHKINNQPTAVKEVQTQ